MLWGYSEVLGIELCWDEGILRLRDPATGEFLRTLEELNEAYLEVEALAGAVEARAGEAEARADAEHAAREAAEARADAERVARESAEARIAEMEAELRRLRGWCE